MKARLILGAVILALAADSFTQNPSPAPSDSAATVKEAVTLQAELTHSLDVRKARVGDPVVARCIHDFQVRPDISIPKNARLIGHLTEVQRKGKGQGESTLGIVFERAQMRDGRVINLTAVIEAITPPTVSLDESESADTTFGSGGGSSGTIGRTPGVIGNLNATAATQLETKVGATTVPGELDHSVKAAANLSGDANSPGFTGIKGLDLDTSASASTNTSVIRSRTQNVRLESGTRFGLRVAIQ